MEYTTTKPTENPSKLSSQFFLFLKLCHRDFSSQTNVKNHDFIKKSVQFSIFLEHPLVYLIESTKSKARDWTNKKRPMHFGAYLSSGELLEWKRFYDKSIIGMYLLMLSSHIGPESLLVGGEIIFFWMAIDCNSDAWAKTLQYQVCIVHIWNWGLCVNLTQPNGSL